MSMVPYINHYPSITEGESDAMFEEDCRRQEQLRQLAAKGIKETWHGEPIETLEEEDQEADRQG